MEPLFILRICENNSSVIIRFEILLRLSRCENSVFGTFEKQAPGLLQNPVTGSPLFPESLTVTATNSLINKLLADKTAGIRTNNAFVYLICDVMSRCCFQL